MLRLPIIPFQLAIRASIIIGLVVIACSVAAVALQILLAAFQAVSLLISGALQAVDSAASLSDTATTNFGALSGSLALVLVQIDSASLALLVASLLLCLAGMEELAQRPVLAIAFDFHRALCKNLLSLDFWHRKDLRSIGGVHEFALERVSVSIIKHCRAIV